MHIKYDPSYFHDMDGRPLLHRGVVARVAFVTLLLSCFGSLFVPGMRVFPRQEVVMFVLASTVAGFLGILIMYRRKRLAEILSGPVRMRYLLIPFGFGYVDLFWAILSNPLPKRDRKRRALFLPHSA